MIDLHLHTTASDGRCDVPALMRLAWEVGLRVVSVTDHDTTAAVPHATSLGRQFGIRVVPGIEITAVVDDRDVHVLGYFIRPDDPALVAFLEHQRADRRDRVRAIGDKLAALGKPIDADALVRPLAARPGHSIGRPAIAEALVAAGHASDRASAFETLIGEGCPAWVPRRGAAPTEVITIIAAAGGIASLAHPGLLGRDDLIAGWAAAGLAAIEAYHAEHTPEDVTRYAEMARRFGLALSGGSDYHGDERTGRSVLGTVTLPAEAFAELEDRVRG